MEAYNLPAVHSLTDTHKLTHFSNFSDFCVLRQFVFLIRQKKLLPNVFVLGYISVKWHQQA